jgi:uncharacterized membrane protein
MGLVAVTGVVLSLRRALTRFERPLRYAMGAVYVAAGVLHFLAPASFERVVPPSLPRPRALVYVSGVAEVVLGAGVLFERTRRLSAWGIVALLVAVFPANVYTVTDDVAGELAPDGTEGVARAVAWARLPFQGVLVLWAWWHSRPDAESET